VELFAPAKASQKHPAIVLLHGVGGPHKMGPVYRTVARRLAGQGFVVLLVHYQQRTGTRRQDLPALRKQLEGYLRDPDPRGPQWQAVRATFNAWLATVGDAVDYARGLPNVDPKRVALVGVSAGAFLANAAACQADGKVACVVGVSGGLPRERFEAVKSMPPALILHGQKDTVVPVREALDLAERLSALKRPSEVHLYPHDGHPGEDKAGMAFLTLLDVERRTVSFLRKHLGKPPVPRAGLARPRP
jgi:carboxymethylenebutenolidase